MPALTTGIDVLKRQFSGGPPPLTPEEIAFTNAPQILAITGSFFGATVLIVMLRCYVRLRMLKVFGIDDYIMVFSTILAAATFACFIFRVEYGLGKHFLVILMDPVQYQNLTMVLYISAILVMVGISSVKVSIAFFLLRLSPQTVYTRFLQSIIAIIILYTIACAGTLIFQCIPVEATWDLSLRPPPFGTGEAKCFSLITFRNIGLGNSAFNILTDALFATMPIPLIWQLQLNLRTKVSLIIVLSLGWFACAASIIKTIQQYNVLTTPDWTVHDSFNVWSYIELTIGIIAASLPCLKPLFNWLLETARAFSSFGRSSGGTEYKGSAHGANNGQRRNNEYSNKSIALTSFTSRAESTPHSSKSPYRAGVPTGLAEQEALRSMSSTESILPHHQHDLTQAGIIVTREVEVSNNNKWSV